MISMMEMTTGQWEIDYSAPDARVSGDSTARLDAYEAPPMAHAGLCEYVTARPTYAGMPVALATMDLDDFLARMAGPAR